MEEPLRVSGNSHRSKDRLKTSDVGARVCVDGTVQPPKIEEKEPDVTSCNQIEMYP